MAKAVFLSVVEFAKLVGVSSQRIHYATKRGKLKFKVVDGIKKIHPVAGKKEWTESLDQTAKKKNPSGIKKDDKTRAKLIAKKLQPIKYQGLTTADAERQEKVYKAKLSELKYLEQAGKLIDSDAVQLEAFEAGRKTRDALMTIPPRLSHELAAETDPHKLEVRLTKEIQKVLEKIITAGGKK